MSIIRKKGGKWAGVVLFAMVAALFLSACTTYVAPQGGPRFHHAWVPGHYNRFGAWIPGHYR